MLLASRSWLARSASEFYARGTFPMNATARRTYGVAACLVVAIIAVCWHTQTGAANSKAPKAIATYLDPPESKGVNSWNQRAAAAYLDQREGWWEAWPKAARDHETFCVSCHTALPYALSRPALRKELAEDAPSLNERRLLDNVTKRVRLWKKVAPFYSDADRGAYKTVESRGTESVLNALILASNDAQSGRLSNYARGGSRRPSSAKCAASSRPTGAGAYRPWLARGNARMELRRKRRATATPQVLSPSYYNRRGFPETMPNCSAASCGLQPIRTRQKASGCPTR